MPADPADPLPGRVVIAGGRAVRVVEQDGDGPGVLLLGGCGVPFYAWDDVVALLPTRRVVRMDRPGLGTPWPGRLPALAEEIETLRELLLSVEGLAVAPVVVAHSMAGPHVEGLVRRYPDRVAALVLVDGSVEDRPAPSRRPDRALGRARAGYRILSGLPPARRLGPLGDRLLSSVQSTRLRLGTPRPVEQRIVFRSPDAVAAVLAEAGTYHAQLADLAALRASTPWPAVETRVLTAAGDGGAGWVRRQASLAELLGARQTVVGDSRHLMMIDRPDLVADAILALDRY